MPDPDSIQLSIVLPAYNEAARIGSSLDELLGHLHESSDLGRWEVIVVDDGSDDETGDLVRAIAGAASGIAADETDAIARARPTLHDVRERGSIRLIRRPHLGKGAAVRAGILAAAGEWVVFMDADLATPPSQLAPLLDGLRDHDLALGSRIHPDGSDRRSSQPRHRRALGRMFHSLAARWVTGPIPDTQCGFKGFRRAAAQDLFQRQQISSIVFDAEIIHLARRRGYRISVVPVHWSDKRGSRMRVRPRLALEVALDLMRIPILHRGVRRVTDPASNPIT